MDQLDSLAALIRQQRNALLTEWRNQLKQLPSARHLDTPTLNDHIPGLLEELAVALQAHADQDIGQGNLRGTPPSHGLQRLKDGFEIEEVVAEYNILRGCIHDLADRNHLQMQGAPFRILNRVLDEAIGMAVQTYAEQKALAVQQRREEYLAFVAHDLRTPLNAISLATRVIELTSSDNAKAEQRAKMLTTLQRNVQHLSTLVNKILEENVNLQTEAGLKLECREFDLWPLVEALIHDLHPVAGTGTTQLVNAIPENLMVYADANLLQRVFQNLIANAIRYTPRGEITIAARLLGDGGTVECEVCDNGSGIPTALVDKVFDKYETDGVQSGSAGLGLAIFKMFIEAHNGTVVVESEEGVGTTFRFTLPGKVTG